MTTQYPWEISIPGERSEEPFDVSPDSANAMIRAYAPKLILMSVFGTVSLDIFCVRLSYYEVYSSLNIPQSYGPLFPFAQYTLLNSLL